MVLWLFVYVQTHQMCTLKCAFFIYQKEIPHGTVFKSILVTGTGLLDSSAEKIPSVNEKSILIT